MNSVVRLSWVETKLLIREPFTLLFCFLFPIVVLLVLAGVFGTDPDEAFGGVSPTDFYVASYLATVTATLALIALPVHLANYRERGILRRLTASSVGNETVLLSHFLVTFVLAALGSILMLTVAVLIYDIQAPASALGVLLAFLIGTMSFITMGLLLGIIMPTARAAQAIGLGLFFPMFMLSGTGPPPEIMTDTMQTISRFIPMTHLVSALQAPWIGDGTDLTELGILLAFMAVAGVVILVRVRRSA